MPDGWQRLDPRMLLIHPFRELGRMIPALIGVAFAGSRLGGSGWWWPLVGVGIVVGSGALRWVTTTYRFGPDQVQLRTGLLRRNTITAATDKVRTVDVSASLLHRVLGLAKVQIGTGGENHLELDGLPAQEAASLRMRLLQRVERAVPAVVGDVVLPATSSAPSASVKAPPADEVLYRFRPIWLRYAPLGPTGFVAAAALLGFLSQFGNEFHWWARGAHVIAGADARGLWVFAVLAMVGVVAIAALAIIGFAISYFGFTLSRDPQGHTLHLQRGLLTTRSTSLELRRLRGVEVRRPLLLRWAGAARLYAVITGLTEDDHKPGQDSLIAPASPDRVVARLADEVLGDTALHLRLQSHGAAATRRRYVRALGPVAVAAAAVVVLGVWSGHVLPAVVVALLAIPAAYALGRDRARSLGHTVAERHLVARRGSLLQRRVALQRHTAVAVTVRSTPFQRRVGLVTAQVATAAGRQRYSVPDVDPAAAARIAAAMLPVSSSCEPTSGSSSH
ncbi:PH domain-containing protein [Calidifontibacter terrae]